MKNIFYGAGYYAERKLPEWKSAGKVPDIFADGNSKKWGSSLDGVLIVSLDEAIEDDDYMIYIAVRPALYNAVHKFLTVDKKIPKEKIDFADEVYYGYGCEQIGTYLRTNEDHLSFCCVTKYRIRIPYTENTALDFENHRKTTEKLIDDLKNGRPTKCDNCSALKMGFLNCNPKVETVVINSVFSENKCNFKCCYCKSYEVINNNPFNRSVVKQMEELEKLMKGQPLNIYIASGEISISSFKKPIIEIAKRNKWWLAVLTNASVYIKELEEISSHASLCVSLDAGTAETFAKVKGVDCFGKVCENLQKYYDHGIIIDLKYILLEGINDNETDITGFIELAEKLKTKVVISFDTTRANTFLSDEMLNTVLLFTEKLKQRNLSYRFDSEYLEREDVKKLGIDV
jgi:pyruvate-formate lyase-activating enzyme